MKLKEYLHRIRDFIADAWGEGKIQRTSRITYDVTWNIILFFIIGGTVLAVFATGAGAGYFASLVQDEPIRDYESMRNDIYNYEETSKLYFADDKYIGDIRADLYREEIQLEGVSDLVLEAVIATEDQLFYAHNGVVPKAIIRALYQEVSNASTKTGGSTLSQQLIKNQILTNEVSFERKAKEILLAMRLENFFEKDEILEAYLNVIPYGRNASGENIAGIQTAAKGVFGKDAKDLSLPQAAFLAGIPKNPFAYTPFTNNGDQKKEAEIKRGKERMKVVLNRMYKENFITEAQYNEAIDYDIKKDLAEKAPTPADKYPAIVTELEKHAKQIILKQIVEGDGLTMDDINNDKDLKEDYQTQADRALRKNGYHIHSTINKDMYQAMQKVGNSYESYGPDNAQNGEQIEAGAVLMENKSGKVLSFYPGRNYEIGGDNEYNYATQAHRPPGSTFKPLAVYAPAMDLGKVQPGSVIADVPTPSGKPKNYGGGYYGLVSVREALTHSYNVTAHNVYTSILDENPAKTYLEKMELPLTEEDKVNASLALGGTKNGITVKENTSAFTTLGNNGKHAESYMIEKITDSDGEIIYEHQADPVEVFSPQTSYLTIDMMRDVINQGTASFIPSRLTNGGVDWAGKTGTSDDYKDAWFVGTNPNVTLGTWIGYDTPSSIYCPGCSLSYSQRNQALWAKFINALTDIDSETMAPKDGFKQPEGIVSSSYCASSGMAPSDICSEAGLVRSDIYNSKYVPGKTDDSLIGGNSPLVVVDGEQVVASDQTPSEFTTSEGGGFTFNPDWISRKGYDRLGDLSQLIPRKHAEAWSKISASGSSSSSGGQIGNDDGSSPPAPDSITNSGGTLSWNGATGKLIVGYRIFRAGEEGGSTELIGHTTDTSYNIAGSSGVYYVKAVNYFGRESEFSSSVEITGSAEENKETEEKEDNNESDSEDTAEETTNEAEKQDNNDDKEKDKNKKEKDKEKNKDKADQKDDKQSDKKQEDTSNNESNNNSNEKEDNKNNNPDNNKENNNES